jgi:flagella synthesis protein FlgN
MTMPRETLSDRDLARVLDEQITAMQDVLAALESERAALAGRDGQALLEAVNRKAAALAGADTVEGRRQAMLEQLGVAPRPGRSFSADAGISQRWQQVLALTQQCRALNDANGQMIRGQRRRVDGALRILRGETAAPAEYGPAGERRANGPRRTLGTY